MCMYLCFSTIFVAAGKAVCSNTCKSVRVSSWVSKLKNATVYVYNTHIYICIYIYIYMYAYSTICSNQSWLWSTKFPDCVLFRPNIQKYRLLLSAFIFFLVIHVTIYIYMWREHIDGLVQGCSFSGVLTMGILQSCTRPLVCSDHGHSRPLGVGLRSQFPPFRHLPNFSAFSTIQ